MTVDTVIERSLANDLADFLGPILGKSDLAVSDLHRKSTGMSRENWTFTVQAERPEPYREELILRRDPIGGMLHTDRRAEYEVLVALHTAGLPIPRVLAVDLDGRRFDRPALVMEIAPGYCDYFVLNGDRPLATRRRLANDFLELLVDLQQVDWRSSGLAQVLQDPGPNAAVYELGRWNKELKMAALEPIPEMELVRVWLQSHARAARRIVLVHGDFKPGNALIHEDAISAMLDWETTHLGDPLEDLGWITNPARAREHQITGYWERAQIIEAFEARTGYPVDEAELHWWNVFACWKLAIIVLTGLRSVVEGKFDRIHHNPTWLYRRMLKMVEF